MLYSRSSANLNSTPGPVVVFLHGLLGSGEDWDAPLQHLGDLPHITIDLPGHGLSALQSCNDFRDCCNQISDTLLTQVAPHRPIVLVGYSLGARIAMTGIAKQYFPSLNIQQVIIEGGNFGLQSDADKQARLKNDAHWADRFSNEPIEQVLNDWYQQPVFSSLKHEQRQELVAKRSANLGPAVATMLMATSLAKQEYLLDSMKEAGVRTHYICGEQDSKFSLLAKQSGLSFSQVAHAGHNAHREQPQAFAKIISNQIETHLAP